MAPSTTLPDWLAQASQALAAGDLAGWMSIYAPDAVHEFPWAPAGGVRSLEGTEAIAEYMGALLSGSTLRFGTIDNVQVREVGDELIVQADGHHQNAVDGSPLEIGYIWFITHRDGKVQHFRDYMGVPAPTRVNASIAR